MSWIVVIRLKIEVIISPITLIKLTLFYQYQYQKDK